MGGVSRADHRGEGGSCPSSTRLVIQLSTDRRSWWVWSCAARRRVAPPVPTRNHDVLVVVADGAAETYAGLRRPETPAGRPGPGSLAGFTAHARARLTHRVGPLLLPRRPGAQGHRRLRGGELVQSKAILTAAEADRAAPLVLDGFLNAVIALVELEPYARPAGQAPSSTLGRRPRADARSPSATHLTERARLWPPPETTVPEPSPTRLVSGERPRTSHPAPMRTPHERLRPFSGA